MKLSALITLVFILVMGCGSPEPRMTHVVPQVRMEIHGDTTFTLHERNLIVLATTRMREQTRGFVDVNVTFDLDFDSIQSLREHVGHNTLVRVDSSAPDLQDTKELKTIGYTYVNYKDLDFNNPTKGALVHDRLKSDDAWVHVAMHEMLHMIRLQHIPTIKTVLYRSIPIEGKNIVTCMTSQDMEELCAVHGCDLKAMKPCNP